MISILKKALILAIVPLCVGGLSFALFDFIQSSYTAEARLKLHLGPTSGNSSRELSLVNMEAQSQGKLNNLVTSMRSENPITFLAFSLAAHDLSSQTPFSMRKQAIDYLPREDRALLASAFREKLTQLDIEFTDSRQDSQMALLLKRLGYTTGSLADKLSISRIPGASQVRIQAHGYTPEMSTYMVNSFCEEFIRYYVTVERERLESSITLLRQIADQKRLELEERTAKLRGEREALRGNGSDPETQNILLKINKLELSLQEEQERIDMLKSRLKRRSDESGGNAIAVRWFQSTQDVRKKNDLAVQLGSAMAHMRYIKQELATLQKQLSQKEDALLFAYEEEVIHAEHAYLSVLDKLREAEVAQTQVERSLELIAKGTSRFPNPIASRFLAGLTALTSFFLWLIWLFQVKYLRWTNISARNLSNSGYPNDH